MNRSCILLPLAAALLLPVSCANRLDPAGQEPVYTITATLEDSDTKTCLNGLSVNWIEGDAIMVFNADCPNGKTYYLAKGAGTKSAVFTTTDPVSGDGPYVALYPALKVSIRSYLTGISDLAVVLDTTQHYVKDSFGYVSTLELDKPSANVAFAQGNDLQNLFFKSAGGLLRMTIKGEKSITGIGIHTLKDEPLGAKLFHPEDGDPAVLKNHVEGTYGRTLFLDCGPKGIPLNETGVDFYFFLPVGSLSEGFQVDIADADGGNMTLLGAADGSCTIERATIRPMPPFTYTP